MRRIWLVVPLLCSFALAQGVGGKAGFGGKAGVGGGAPSGGSPITFVQAAAASACNGFGPGVTVCASGAFASTTTTGNALLVGATWCERIGGGGSGFTITFSDTKGDTFTTVTATLKAITATTDCSELGVELGYSSSITAQTSNIVSCTFSTAPASADAGCFAIEISPVGSFTTLNNVGTASGTAVSAGSVTTTINGAIGFTVAGIDDGFGAGTIFGTAGSGWTIARGAGNGNEDFGSEYKAQATAASITGNLTAGHTGSWVAAMLVIEP